MTVPTPVWWTWLACVQSNLHPVHHDRPTRPELVPSRPVVRPCNRSTAVSAHATGDFITSSDIALYNGGVDKTALVMGDCDRYAVGTCRRPPTDRPMSWSTSPPPFARRRHRFSKLCARKSFVTIQNCDAVTRLVRNKYVLNYITLTRNPKLPRFNQFFSGLHICQIAWTSTRNFLSYTIRKQTYRQTGVRTMPSQIWRM